MQISLANPHATLRYVPPVRETDDEMTTYARVTQELPPETAEIQPHPYGVELGVLMQMLRESKAKNLGVFLASEFSRISSRLAVEIAQTAKLDPGARPRTLSDAKIQDLHTAIAATKIMACCARSRRSIRARSPPRSRASRPCTAAIRSWSRSGSRTVERFRRRSPPCCTATRTASRSSISRVGAP
jgi:DNA topoisomerase VI subunit B